MYTRTCSHHDPDLFTVAYFHEMHFLPRYIVEGRDQGWPFSAYQAATCTCTSKHQWRGWSRRSRWSKPSSADRNGLGVTAEYTTRGGGGEGRRGEQNKEDKRLNVFQNTFT